jgi:hypothetical protein
MSTREISREEFMTYEDIRQSGLTNMFDVRRVIELSDEFGEPLDRDMCMQIMENYSSLSEQFLD